MKTATAKLLCEAAEAQGHEVSTIDNYSGRGMYGDTTVAIDCEAGAASLIAAGMAMVLETMLEGRSLVEEGYTQEELSEIAEDLSSGFSTDSMGKSGTVIY